MVKRQYKIFFIENENSTKLINFKKFNKAEKRLKLYLVYIKSENKSYFINFKKPNFKFKKINYYFILKNFYQQIFLKGYSDKLLKESIKTNNFNKGFKNE